MNLTAVSKILERLARFKPHIAASLNCQLHSAYCAAHSMKSAVVQVVDDIVHFIYASSTIMLVGLNISTTFDMVNHNVPFRQLERDFGISSLLIFLSARSFFVHFITSSLSCAPTSTCMPHGSILGPPPFTFYMAPIIRLIKSYGIKYHKYADDTPCRHTCGISMMRWHIPCIATRFKSIQLGSGGTCWSIQTSPRHASSSSGPQALEPASWCTRDWKLLLQWWTVC